MKLDEYRAFGVRVMVVFFGLILLLPSSMAHAQEVTLKLHHFLGPKAPAHTHMLKPWAERIAKASNGRIQIEIYPAMSLGGTPPQLIGQARDGVVDIVWTVNGYTAGLFPRSEVFELPFVHTNNAVATNLAMHDMFDEYLATEYQGVKVLFTHVHAGQAFHMVDTPIRKPEDVRGMKLRIPSRTGAWIIEALGATPVGMPVPDLPQALSKKVIDGALVPFEIVRPLKLHQMTQYQIEGPISIRFGTTTFQTSMNADAWNKLPADLQQVFLQQSGAEWHKEIGRIWTNSENGGLAALQEAGNEHIQLKEEELAAFRKRMAPVIDKWLTEVKSKGINGQRLLDKARELISIHTRG